MAHQRKKEKKEGDDIEYMDENEQLDFINKMVKENEESSRRHKVRIR
jgi:hypothetical protein